MKKYFSLFAFLIFIQQIAFAQPNLPYKNLSLPIGERVKDLLQRMTLEEKFWQMFMIPGDLDNADSSQYTNCIKIISLKKIRQLLAAL